MVYRLTPLVCFLALKGALAMNKKLFLHLNRKGKRVKAFTCVAERRIKLFFYFVVLAAIIGLRSFACAIEA